MLAGLFAVAFIAGAVHGVLRPGYTYAENVGGVAWLPAEARNISYYRSYSYTAYEFDISEEGFRDWAGYKRWRLSAIEDPVTVLRYNWPIIKSPENFEGIAPAGTDGKVTIESGLIHHTDLGAGGGIWVAYDTDAGRAYYQSKPR